jgi:hypothetical protein
MEDRHNHRPIDILSNELTVTGKNQIEIELLPRRPETVIVEFKSEARHIPCNPAHDHLGWEVFRKHGAYYLRIWWNVSSPREIIWVVGYI